MNFAWDNAAVARPLNEVHVHVWAADLSGPSALHVVQLLSEDEHARAERFHFQQDRSRFIIARATLRTILGQYLGIAPTRVQFAYGANGKPTLANLENVDQILHFSVARSQGVAVYALSYCAPLGVDIEYLRPLPDMSQIAERFFSRSEHTALSAVPSEQRVRAFYKCWTSKEAFLKATGDGLSFALERFDVELRPERPSRLHSIDGDTDLAAPWTIRDFAPSPGYIGALAIKRHDVAITFMTWRPNPDSRS